MENKGKMPDRRSVRLRGYDYSQAGAYYVTVCVESRRCVLSMIDNAESNLNDYGEAVRDEILKTPQIRTNIIIDEFVIMPNHFHLIIIINSEKGVILPGVINSYSPEKMPFELNKDSLGAVMAQIKSITTKKIRKLGLKDFEWQRGYYEHVVRDEEDLMVKKEYIVNNPLQWELDDYNPHNKKTKAENP